MLYSQKKNVEWEYLKAVPPVLDGLKSVDQKGYVRVAMPRTDSAKGYIYEHRLVMQQHIGRKLRPYESIHHINEIKVDNRIENLFLTTNSEHTALHREGKNQNLKRRTKMRNKVRKRRQAKIEIRSRNSRGQYI